MTIESRNLTEKLRWYRCLNFHNLNHEQLRYLKWFVVLSEMQILKRRYIAKKGENGDLNKIWYNLD